MMRSNELEEEIATPIKRGTNLFGVQWSGHSPGDVPIILGSIAEAYLLRTKELDDEGFRNNAKLFEDEGRHIKFMLQDLLDDLQAFIQAKGITTLDDTRFSTTMFEMQKLTENMTITRQGLTSLNQQYHPNCSENSMEQWKRQWKIVSKQSVIPS